MSQPQLLSTIEHLNDTDLQAEVGTPELSYDIVFEEYLDALEDGAEAKGRLIAAKQAFNEAIEQMPEYQEMVNAEIADGLCKTLAKGWETAVKRVALADWKSKGSLADAKQYRGGFVQVRERINIANEDAVIGWLLRNEPKLLKMSVSVAEFNKRWKAGALNECPDVALEKDPIFTINTDLSEFYRQA